MVVAGFVARYVRAPARRTPAHRPSCLRARNNAFAGSSDPHTPALPRARCPPTRPITHRAGRGRPAADSSDAHARAPVINIVGVHERVLGEVRATPTRRPLPARASAEHSIPSHSHHLCPAQISLSAAKLSPPPHTSPRSSTTARAEVLIGADADEATLLSAAGVGRARRRSPPPRLPVVVGRTGRFSTYFQGRLQAAAVAPGRRAAWSGRQYPPQGCWGRVWAACGSASRSRRPVLPRHSRPAL